MVVVVDVVVVVAVSSDSAVPRQNDFSKHHKATMRPQCNQRQKTKQKQTQGSFSRVTFSRTSHYPHPDLLALPCRMGIGSKRVYCSNGIVLVSLKTHDASTRLAGQAKGQTTHCDLHITHADLYWHIYSISMTRELQRGFYLSRTLWSGATLKRLPSSCVGDKKKETLSHGKLHAEQEMAAGEMPTSRSNQKLHAGRLCGCQS